MIDLRKTDHIKTFGNSMYPLLHDGDILYYQKSPFNEIKIDDIILFKKKDRYITHRVICRKNDYVVTKGDNVLKSDGKIFQNAIVGKVNKIKRNDTFFDLKNLYLIQSTIYLRELSHMFAELSQKKMPFVVLKGLPLVQYYFNSIPERLYADCDILTEKSHEKQFNEIFCRHLYKKHKKELVRENIHEGKHIYEENYYKFIHNVPVSIDVHLEAVFTFTRDDFSEFTYPLSLLEKLTHYLFYATLEIRWNGIFLKILSPDALIVYLCLHFFHHNYKGAHRLQFLSEIIEIEYKKDKKIVNKIKKICDEFKLHGYVDPVFAMLNTHYVMDIPLEKVCSSTIAHKLKRKLVLIFLGDYFNDEGRVRSGITKYFLLLLLSPVPFFKRLLILTKIGLIRHGIILIFQKGR